MTVEYRCPGCGHVFDPDWISDWEVVEFSNNYLYQYCTVDCDCGRHLTFTTYYEATDVEVEE